MTKIFCFLHCRLRIEEILIIHPIIHKGVDSEISNPERSQILKEMCPLTGIYPIVGQSGFHNHTGSRDMRPLHRDAEPSIAASPTSRTDKHIILSFIQELLVDLFYLPGNCLIVGGTIIIGLYIDHIINIIHDTVSQWIIWAENHIFIRNLIQILIQHFFTVYDRTDLQEIKSSGFIMFAT